MVIGVISVIDKFRKIRVFKETFLLADISMEVVLKIPFLSFNYMNIDFKVIIGKLTWMTYIAIETISIAKKVELIDKYKFVKAALNRNFETFMVYIVALETTTVAMPIYLLQIV